MAAQAPGTSATAPNPARVVFFTPTSWARRLLADDSEPVTPSNVEAVRDWETQEGGAGPEWGTDNTADYNPLNTTTPEPGSYGTGDQGDIQAYASWNSGFAGTVTTLQNGRYGPIQSALKAGNNPQAVETAVTSSPWGTKSLTLGEGNANHRRGSGPIGTYTPTGGAGTAGSNSQSSQVGGSSWIQGLDSALNPSGGNIVSSVGDAIKEWGVRGGLALLGVVLVGLGLFVAFGHDIFGFVGAAAKVIP